MKYNDFDNLTSVQFQGTFELRISQLSTTIVDPEDIHIAKIVLDFTCYTGLYLRSDKRIRRHCWKNALVITQRNIPER